jgi:hypothetical protein
MLKTKAVDTIEVEEPMDKAVVAGVQCPVEAQRPPLMDQESTARTRNSAPNP